ncbi:hypothetical protein ATCV1_Z627L [Acanthocystis turfacea chlorella virus 1]|uniref:Uncharacterized protein Z627L n=1 Tax=Chlorovirus heliozoae TaxID=322019 RepID=A7K9N7_9PHYC|nr:hypothetical protein ATCV1_Z627L [Acanthocystis turfacea chlorella virus 1]ABT16761.1 hypothetical protein ATCV1_Z627L [Acanthocystis turfacea chlorella virus 1]
MPARVRPLPGMSNCVSSQLMVGPYFAHHACASGLMPSSPYLAILSCAYVMTLKFAAFSLAPIWGSLNFTTLPPGRVTDLNPPDVVTTGSSGSFSVQSYAGSC